MKLTDTKILISTGYTMVKDGILTKLDKNQATEWLNSFVVVRKPSGNLRICLDPTDLNPHIIRPVCNSNTLDDVVHKLRKAKYYAVFDATKGFFHVPLDDNAYTPWCIHL